MGNAEVFRLPDAWTQNCYACMHASQSEAGTYCLTFGEMILSEAIAGRDCPAFDASDEKTYVRVDE